MSFDRLAAVYDILSNPEKRLEREGPFLRQWAGNTSTVLDLACGTGAHAYSLAVAGHQVTACDLSPQMVAFGKEHRSHPALTWQVADMCNPPGKGYDRVYCIGNSINLLPSLSAVETVLQAVADRLNEEGSFLLHLINPEHPDCREAGVTVRTAMVDGASVTVVKSMAPTPVGRALTVTRVFADRTLESEPHLLLDLTQGRLESLLESNGWQVEQCYGDFRESPFQPETSRDLVLVARVGG